MLEKSVFVTNQIYLSRIISVKEAVEFYMAYGDNEVRFVGGNSFFKEKLDRIRKLEEDYPKEVPFNELDGWKIKSPNSLYDAVRSSIF